MTASFREQLQRAFLAWLCLWASLAYVTREQQVDLLAALLPMMDMAAMDSAPAAPLPEHSPEHHHAGHCPFCFMAAFALAAQGGPFLQAAEAFSIWLCLAAPRPHVRPARRFYARAPPLAGLFAAFISPLV